MGLGRAQRFILGRVTADPVGVTSLARDYFDVERPTRAQLETMRRAIRTLDARGLVSRAWVRSAVERSVRGHTMEVVAPCDGPHCQACYYGASWFPPTQPERRRAPTPFAKRPAPAATVIEDVYGAGPDVERAREHGYHRWTPIRGTGDQTDGYSYVGDGLEVGVRTPMTDAERAAAAETRAAVLTQIATSLGGRA